VCSREQSDVIRTPADTRRTARPLRKEYPHSGVAVADKRGAARAEVEGGSIDCRASRRRLRCLQAQFTPIRASTKTRSFPL
jgi:hypothetical protein